MMDKIQSLRVNLAAAKYGNPNRMLKIIAVAGPYGKTTTIRFLEGILRESGKNVTALSNEKGAAQYSRSLDGFFKQLASARKNRSDFVIIEINEQLEKSHALKAVLLDSLIITGEFDGSSELLKLQPKHVVVPSGLEVPTGTVEPYQHISFGEDDLAEAKIDDVKLFKNGSELAITIDHQTKLELATYLVGQANAKSLATAVAAAYVLGTNLDAVQEGIADIQPMRGRFMRSGSTDPIAIVDVGTNEESVKLAAVSAKTLAKRRLIIAAGKDIAQHSLELLKESADRLFVVSTRTDNAAAVDLVSSNSEAIEKAKRAAKPGDVMLFLGAKFEFDSTDLTGEG